MERQPPKRNTYQGQQGQQGQQQHPHPPRHHGGPRHKGMRHPSSNMIYEIYHAGNRRLNRISSFELFFLSVLGGAFMCAGSLLSVLLTNDSTVSAMVSILTALGLTIGLLFVILTHIVLVTEPNVYVPGNFNHLSIIKAFLRLFRFWLIAWIGNFVGAFILAYLVYLSQEYSPALSQLFANVTANKLAHVNGTLRGTGELIISALLANWLIATSTFFAIASRNLINQFIILFLTFVLIIAANFQYFPANLGYFLLGAFFGNQSMLSNGIFFNLIPVSLGNILGAAVFVSSPLLFLSKKRN
jgi:formate/nitrite transporter FocA (FNT family)